MRVRTTIAGILLPVLFITGIFISSAVGYWRTESSKTPAKYTEGIFEGAANPADIRGSYSFLDLQKAFDIPVATLVKAFGFSGLDNPDDIKVKEFEGIYGLINEMEIGTGSMRLFVALYKGLPFEADSDTAIPQPAWNILSKEGDTDKDVLSEYSYRVVSIEGVKPGAIMEDQADESEEKLIKGKTLFSELLNWGLNREQISEAMGLPMGAGGISVREYCSDNEIEFSTVKIPLQELLDNM